MKKIIYIISLAVFIASCTEDLGVDFSTITERGVVIDGGITNDTMAHTVKLSYTFDYNDTEISSITNANVSITGGTDTFYLKEVSDGIYQTDSSVFGVPGNVYTLRVELEGGDIYTASDYLNSQLGIDSIRIDSVYDIFSEKYITTIKFFGQEKPEPNNFYRWDYYIDGQLITDTVSEISFERDDWLNGKYVYDFDVFYLNDYEIPEEGSVVTMEMRLISEEYYDFILSLMLETDWRGGPFDATPANVTTNVDNGYGFFYAASVSRSSTIYKTKE